jgi:hypothetical protein
VNAKRCCEVRKGLENGSGISGEVMCGPEGISRYIRKTRSFCSFRPDDGYPFGSLSPNGLQGKTGSCANNKSQQEESTLRSTVVDGAHRSGSHLTRRCWDKFGRKTYACSHSARSGVWKHNSYLPQHELKSHRIPLNSPSLPASIARYVIAAGPRTGASATGNVYEWSLRMIAVSKHGVVPRRITSLRFSHAQNPRGLLGRTTAHRYRGYVSCRSHYKPLYLSRMLV